MGTDSREAVKAMLDAAYAYTDAKIGIGLVPDKELLASHMEAAINRFEEALASWVEMRGQKVGSND